MRRFRLTHRAVALVIGLASLATFASASDVLVIVNATVDHKRGNGITSGIFSNVQIGEAVTFVGGASAESATVPPIGARHSLIDHETFYLQMGSVSQTNAIYLDGAFLSVGNDFMVSGLAPYDALTMVFATLNDGSVTLSLFDLTAAMFSTNDIRLLTGNYVQSLPLSNLYVANPGGNNQGLVCRLNNVEVIQKSQLGQTLCSVATPNSTGVQGELTAEGFDHAYANDLTIRGTNLPIGQFGMLVGSKTTTAPTAVANSQGFVCLGGNVGRFNNQIKAVGSSATAPGVGVILFKPDLDAIPQQSGFVPATAGETWTFQSWHRDVVGGAATSNFTTAVAVTLR